MIESYHGHLKMDYLWTREPTSFGEIRVLLAEALRHYTRLPNGEGDSSA
jgi:hypothetical protein